MLRKMLYSGAILIILPVLCLILSINLLKIKFDNRKKIEYNEKYK